MNVNRKTWKVFVPESDDHPKTRRYRPPASHVSGVEAGQTYVDILGEQNVSYQINAEHQQETYLVKPKQKSIKCRESSNIRIKDLYMCAQNNNAYDIEKILSAKIEWLNSCDDYGWTPLMVACQAGCIDAVKMLLRFRANISIEDKAGNTAFSLAKKNHNHAIMKTLAMTLKTNDSPAEFNGSGKITSNKSLATYYCNLCEESYKDIQSHVSSTLHNFNASKKCKRKIFYGIPESNKGYQLMLKTGWDKNNGLGPDGGGQKFPIKTALKLDRKGIGIAGETPKVTHADKELLEAAKEKGNTGFGKRDIDRNRRKEKYREKMFRREFYS